MRVWVKTGCWILLLGSWVGVSGCLLLAAGAGAGAGVGATQYVRGELSQAYAAPIEKAWSASLAAAEELNMKTSEKSIDNMDRNRWIRGKTEDNKECEIHLESLGNDVTKIGVRIGVFGDEAYSRKIQEVVAKNLQK